MVLWGRRFLDVSVIMVLISESKIKVVSFMSNRRKAFVLTSLVFYLYLSRNIRLRNCTLLSLPCVGLLPCRSLSFHYYICFYPDLCL